MISAHYGCQRQNPERPNPRSFYTSVAACETAERGPELRAGAAEMRPHIAELFENRWLLYFCYPMPCSPEFYGSL